MDLLRWGVLDRIRCAIDIETYCRAINGHSDVCPILVRQRASGPNISGFGAIAILAHHKSNRMDGFGDVLQDIGAISYVRGRIQILDRQKLEDTACECYRVVRDEFDRLLG